MINLLTKSLTLFILLTSLYLNGQIRIDGQFDDWTQITTTDDSGDGFDIDIESVSITNNAIDLFIKVTLNQEIDLLDSENLAIFIDADNNPETGFPVNGIGSEITYYFGDRNGFINFPDEFINVNHSILGIIPAPTVTSNTFEFSVNRGFQNDIGPMSLGAQISIVISNAVDGGDSVPNDEGGILYQWNYQNAEDIPYSLDKQEDNFRLLSYNVENSSFFNEENGPIQQKLLTLAQPDIIAFQEMIESDTEAETVLNQLWDNDEDWLCTSYGFDTKLCLQGIEFEAGTSIDGNTANLLIFDDGSELIIINAHLPCCDKDEERQGEIDHILARIRDGEYGFLAQENTPVVITGDLNLVGLAQNITSLTNGDIVDEASYGSDFTPDHNGSNYIDAAPTCTGIPYSYTWNNLGGSYAPGRLDFIIYGGDYLKLTNSLVMATEGFTASDRFNNNILRTDSQNASDHYPILADFTFNIDEDGDGFTYQEDCNDNDSSINPDADDIPNNELDEDCDGVALQIDEDEDGYNSDEDCDDTVAAVNPDAVEIPNDGIDNNCDGNIDETYLEFPYEGWKQVINSSFWTGWETREFVSTYEYNNAESFNWENGILVLEGFDAEPDRLICDFTLKVGDNVDLEAFGNPKTYSVTEKYRTLNLVQDSVWYLELIPLESSSPTDTLRWMEGVGDLATGIFRHSAGFEGGTSHACTLDSLNRRIGVNLNYYSTCDCDNFLGVDEDNDGFSNHVGASSVIGTSSLSPLHLSHFKTRTCDTLSIEVHFDNIESPMLSLDESCGEIIEQDEIIYDQTGIPIATYLYFELPEVETLYFFDQCILLAEIKVLNCIETDCDDTNPDVNPDAVEIPNNGMDDDCDGEELIMIDEDGDGFNSDEDCDDTNADINPDATEIVNNDIDEDCDGIAIIIDEDFDGFNSDEDCDDNNPDVNPDAPEIPNNEVDENCDDEILIIDEDEDGFNSDEDCDDDNPDVNPDAEEIPNNEMDEDCDGIALIIDDDFDGFNSDDDCDDMNPDINPDASEIVNNDIDEDCDGEALIIDEDGDGFHSDQDCDDNNTAINPGAIEVPYNGIDEDCDPTTLDDDLDQDGFNLDEDCNDINTNINPDATEITYNGIDDDCDPTTLDDDLDQDGFTLSEDCDDNTADVNPDANEITYNGIDDDCDPTTLDDDLDQDGFNSDEDCDDNNADVNPGTNEIAYNGIDDDCDPTTLDDDLDQDGFNSDEDCADNNADVNPDATEIAYNGIDDDCNPETLDDDLDQDGFDSDEDCDDNNPEINPDAIEVCDDSDNNCDGNTDEGLEFVVY